MGKVAAVGRVAQAWDPFEHPRDYEGQFREVPDVPGVISETDVIPETAAERTQISRAGISAPTRRLTSEGRLKGRVLHHGSGRAHEDTAAMRAADGVIDVTEFDPYPDARKGKEYVEATSDRTRLAGPYDTAVSNYVLNVLPPNIRDQVVGEIADSLEPDGTAYISVRPTADVEAITSKTPEADGYRTSKGTFQKGFTPQELQEYLGQWFEETEVVRGTGGVTVAASKPRREVQLVPQRHVTTKTQPDPDLDPTVLSNLPVEVQQELISRVEAHLWGNTPASMVDNILALFDRADEVTRDDGITWYDRAAHEVAEMAKRHRVTRNVMAGMTAATSVQQEWGSNVVHADYLARILSEDPVVPWQMLRDREIDKKGKGDKVGKKQSALEWARDETLGVKGTWPDDVDGLRVSDLSPQAAASVIKAMGQAGYGLDGHPLRWWNPDKKPPAWEPCLFTCGTRGGADAVRVFRTGDPSLINGHKVRNFYNGLRFGSAAGKFVVIDRHALSAALAHKIVSVDAKNVSKGFDTPTLSEYGLKGTYPVLTEAYRVAAKRAGVSPAAMQAIVWLQWRVEHPPTSGERRRPVRRQKKELDQETPIWLVPQWGDMSVPDRDYDMEPVDAWFAGVTSFDDLPEDAQRVIIALLTNEEEVSGEKAIVRTQEGAAKYGVPIGAEIGSGKQGNQGVEDAKNLTAEELRMIQQASGLPVTGKLDKATIALVRKFPGKARKPKKGGAGKGSGSGGGAAGKKGTGDPATDWNAKPKDGKLPEEDQVPEKNPDGSPLKDYVGPTQATQKGIEPGAYYEDGSFYGKDGWKNKPKSASAKKPAAGKDGNDAAESAAPKAQPGVTAEGKPDPSAGRFDKPWPELFGTEPPKQTKDGSRRVLGFPDGSAIYENGVVWSPTKKEFVTVTQALADLTGAKPGQPIGAKTLEDTMETKTVHASGVVDLWETKTTETPDGDGVVRCIVSVTGIEDEVHDIIEPGAYKDTLTKRSPKGVWSHSWERPIARTLSAEELLPGDPRLPTGTKDGKGWPGSAGAAVVTTQFNLNVPEGKHAYETVKFFGPEQEWSIGYKVPRGGAYTNPKTGVRHIKRLEWYEYSPVLFGAMPLAGTLAAKHLFDALEGKDLATGVAGIPPVIQTGVEESIPSEVFCDECGDNDACLREGKCARTGRPLSVKIAPGEALEIQHLRMWT